VSGGNISTSRLGSVSRSGKTGRRLLVSITVHVRGRSVGRGCGSLASHVRRDVSGSLGVELDSTYLSASLGILQEGSLEG
jgi:hypothetical protein